MFIVFSYRIIENRYFYSRMRWGMMETMETYSFGMDPRINIGKTYEEIEK
ncbi:MAG: hypothetical protein R3A11_08745 [Bdellovibrionota bacterium]